MAKPAALLLPQCLSVRGSLDRKWAFFPLGRWWRLRWASLEKAGFSAPILQARAPQPPWVNAGRQGRSSNSIGELLSPAHVPGGSLDTADLREIRTAVPSFESYGANEGLADKIRLAALCSRFKQAGDGRRAEDC